MDKNHKIWVRGGTQYAIFLDIGFLGVFEVIGGLSVKWWVIGRWWKRGF